MRTLLEDCSLRNPLFETGIKSRVLKGTITDNYQLTVNHPLFMWLDPNGGNKDVRLPLATDVNAEGLMFFIINDADAAESILVKNTGETETVLTIGQGNIGIVFNDGASVTGWVGAVFDQTVAGTLTTATITGNASVGGTLDVVGVSTLTDLDLGASGTAGTLDVFPSTASRGKLALSVTDQTGDTTVDLVVGAMAAARTITLRDPGAAASLLTTTDATAAATSATALELTRIADVSTRLVAAGSTLAVTVAAHADRIIALDTAAGSTCTLPAATGSGAVFRFVTTTVPTSNQHTVVVTTTDVMKGSFNLLDNDSTALTAYAASSTDDTIKLNGTTTGGQLGDWIEFVDIAAATWSVRGQGVVPAGSNIADCFSATAS